MCQSTIKLSHNNQAQLYLKIQIKSEGQVPRLHFTLEYFFFLREL